MKPNLPRLIGTRTDPAFYTRPTAKVAKELIGKILVRFTGGQIVGGIIVETEAYLDSDDLASHSARGRTKSNASMFAAAGTLYVYPIHSRHCLNVSTVADGVGAAVLIRAIEPVWGISTICDRRSVSASDDRSKWNRSAWRRLTSGPGMICEALNVDRSLDGIAVGSDLRLGIFGVGHDSRFANISIRTSPRIGISKSAELPLRFFADGNLFVSGRAADHVAPRQSRLLAAN